MSSNNISNQNLDFLGKEEEIDLNSLAIFIFRRKKIISLFAGLGFIYGLIYGIFSQKVWEGRFQIVLGNSQNEQSIINQNNVPSFLTKQLNSNSNLMTEVEILKSPSVLFDIFKYVKTQKNNLNPGSSERIRFDDWLENLEIKLKKSTSVLNLSYRDTDRQLILPVLEKISFAYIIWRNDQ